jgi:uncharacterized protein (TIGR03437 family)
MLNSTITRLLLTGALALPVLAQQPAFVVGNSASFARFPIAQGSLATAGGAFTGVTATAASAIPFPNELAGVRVFVNNVQSPVQFAGPTQINFQVPFGTPVGRSEMRIALPGGTELRGFIDVLEVGPGLYADLGNASPNKPGRVLNQNNTINGPNNPARRGEVVQIYCTGVGTLETNPPDGAGATTLIRVRENPRVFISVISADVQFAGLSQFPGVWQVNAFVPNRDFITGEVPVAIAANGIESNQVSIWVQ